MVAAKARPTTSRASSEQRPAPATSPSGPSTMFQPPSPGKNLTDGVTGAIREDVAVQAPIQRQTEPSVTLFAPDPVTDAAGSPRFAASAGGDVTLDRPAARADLSEQEGRRHAHVRAGDPLLVYAGAKPVRMHIRDVVRFDGATTADSALLLPLAEAQRLFNAPGLIEGIAISNRGSGDAAVAPHGPSRRNIEAGRDAARPGDLDCRRRTRSSWPTRPATRSCRCSRRSARSRSPPGSSSSS